jgi:hypothetical protein
MAVNERNKALNRRIRLNSTTMIVKDMVQMVDRVELPDVGAVNVQIFKGDFNALPVKVRQFIARYVSSQKRGLQCQLETFVLCA